MPTGPSESLTENLPGGSEDVNVGTSLGVTIEGDGSYVTENLSAPSPDGKPSLDKGADTDRDSKATFKLPVPELTEMGGGVMPQSISLMGKAKPIIADPKPNMIGRRSAKRMLNLPITNDTSRGISMPYAQYLSDRLTTGRFDGVAQAVLNALKYGVNYQGIKVQPTSTQSLAYYLNLSEEEVDKAIDELAKNKLVSGSMVTQIKTKALGI